MENLQSHGIHIPLFPIFLCLLQFSSFRLISLAYDLPEKYFINCGSNANVNYTSRTFTGDTNTGYVTKGDHGSAATDRNQSVDGSSLYKTARIFKQQSWYEFEIDTSGPQLVRLHFLAFTSTTTDDLSTAIFDVSASEFLLLHNFTARNNKSSPLIKEFFLSINSPQLRIYFTPQGSSFAFINAIEVFLSPTSFYNNGTTNSLSYPFLQTLYRVNVGGQAIKPDSDTVWRNWDQDDIYLSNPSNAKNSLFYSAKPNYVGNMSDFIAPDLVYQTAKVIDNNNSSESNNSNATWSFNVNKTASHVGRVHFCDTVSKSLNTVSFTLYINDNASLIVNSIDFVDQLAAPFFVDFSVEPDGSGILNVSIGTLSNSTDKKAYLNGLEILQVKEGFASVPVENNSKKINVAVIIGSVAGGLAVISILVIGFLFVLKRRKSRPVETYDWSPVPVFGAGSSHSRLTESTIHGSPAPDLHLGLKISFPEIQFATNNFDPRLLIGKGGFGSVYRGTLPNGKQVAVKRGARESGQGLPEFQTEIMVLSKIRHRHLVSLIGYCDERFEMILVYEYMEKGTLRDHLYNSNLPRLSWKQRLEICIGAANGLTYLHRGAAGGIIHRDVKSTNILLDQNHVAKVADFGLSKSGPQDETHVSTSVKGTLGYLDPEYFRCQQLTEKSDVFSFGVVLLEVLCARLPIDNSLPREQMNLVEWGLYCKKKGVLEEIIDPSLRGQIDPNSLRKFSDVAEKCLQEDGADRPTMSDVIWDLEYALQLQQTATRREPHDDTTTGSSALILPDVQRFPSLSTTIDRDDIPIFTNDFSSTTGDEIFSQLRVNDAR
ncbi:probable receptor-like protein kinase At2g23200 [Ziziphus jujuba]|uniref:Probable receptor-like protein kinase At2g23200 n=1 Tax=Ziziphus jujuba TaxID=326968 RepID=A0ABM3IU34_ZIZJJ|nr:probable receptor-like protein kinase At2g23200 [Ziziphus jujuba]